MANVNYIKCEPMQVKWGAIDLGYLQGGIEVSLEEMLLDVTANQTGQSVLTAIRQGFNVEVSCTLLEVTKEQLKRMITAAGGSYTPAGEGATEVFGFGMSKQFSNVASDCQALTLHPVAKSASDHSGDWTFFKAYPMLSSINFSGEETLTLPITFKVYPDETTQGAVRYFAVGDSTQDLSV